MNNCIIHREDENPIQEQGASSADEYDVFDDDGAVAHDPDDNGAVEHDPDNFEAGADDLASGYDEVEHFDGYDNDEEVDDFDSIYAEPSDSPVLGDEKEGESDSVVKEESFDFNPLRESLDESNNSDCVFQFKAIAEFG